MAKSDEKESEFIGNCENLRESTKSEEACASPQTLALFSDCQEGVYSNTPSKLTSYFCAFDGGTRYSVQLMPTAHTWQFLKALLPDLRETHEITREPVFVNDFLTYRGAGASERSYFRDRPYAADVFEFGDFKIVIPFEVFDGLLAKNTRTCYGIVILGWKIFSRFRHLTEAYQHVRERVRDVLGFALVLDQIRRVDFNLTTSKIPIDVVGDAYRDKRIRTKVRTCRPWDGKPCETETLYIGKKDNACIFRAYDKTKELMASIQDEDSRAKAAFLYSVLDVQSVSQITRFEFELHHEFLKDFAIKSFEDLESKLQGIILYLFRDWLRFLAKRETSGRKDREVLASWWETVRDEFLKFAHELSNSKRKCRRLIHQATMGKRSLARARKFLEIAAKEYMVVSAKIEHKDSMKLDVDEVAKSLAAVLRNVEGEWGGKTTPKAYMMNYVVSQIKNEL